MDKLLTCEFPQLIATGDLTSRSYFDFNNSYRFPNTTFPLQNNTIFVYDTVIDLQGYQMKDMTAYYRQSFEQRGLVQVAKWDASTLKPITPFNAAIYENIIIASVPLTDDNLVAFGNYAPGFASPDALPIVFQPATLNREHIIHGRLYIHGLDTTLGVDLLTDDGAGLTRIIQEYDYSSLEPTAVDKLYCYRIISLSGSSEPLEEPITPGYNQVSLSPVRVLLDAKFEQEDTIPYFMRLKRGYELANQV